MSSPTYVADLLIHTGTDFTQTFVLEDSLSASLKDLTGYSACCSMRKYESSSVAASFSTSFSADRTDGKLEIEMLQGVTATLKPGKYFYDIILQDSAGTKDRIIEGTVTVKKSVTR